MFEPAIKSGPGGNPQESARMNQDIQTEQQAALAKHVGGSNETLTVPVMEPSYASAVSGGQDTNSTTEHIANSNAQQAEQAKLDGLNGGSRAAKRRTKARRAAKRRTTKRRAKARRTKARRTKTRRPKTRRTKAKRTKTRRTTKRSRNSAR